MEVWRLSGAEGPKAQGPEPSKSTVLSVRPVNIALGPLPDVEASGNPFCFLGIVVVHHFLVGSFNVPFMSFKLISVQL